VFIAYTKDTSEKIKRIGNSGAQNEAHQQEFRYVNSPFNARHYLL
jgi:hypothetical protein